MVARLRWLKMASCSRRRVAEGRSLHSRIHSTMTPLLASLFLLGSVATPLAAQRRGTPERPSQLQVVEVKQNDGQILSYRYLAASTEVTMRGTPFAPGAHIKLKVGSRPGFVEIAIN